MTQRRVFLLGLGAAFIASRAAEAQEPKKLYRIGILSNASGIDSYEGFQRGLRELGYLEGQNIVLEWRFAKGNLDRLPDLAT